MRSAEPWDRHGFDVLVLVVAAASVTEIVWGNVGGPAYLLVPAALAYSLSLLLRRRVPFAAPLFALAVQVTSSFVDVPGGRREDSGVIAYLLAVWVLAAWNPRPRALAGLAAALAGIVAVTIEDSRIPAGEASSVALLAIFVWLFGAVLRERTLRIEAAEERAAELQQHQERAERTLALERARIARELHDVVAHSVSVMTVQAGAARMLLPTSPRRAVDPLLAVEETGRQALDELRRLVGVLRDGADRADFQPQPGLDDLPALVETMCEAGLPVELVVSGEARAVPPGVGLAAYRIVQEALTNTLKHAGPARARLTVTYSPETLAVEVHDDGRSRPPAGKGHGLVGMRERVAIYGGHLEAGPRSPHGYAVHATLPLRAPGAS